MAVTASLDLFEGTFWQDPYPAYAALRATEPVRRIERPAGPIWLISRYADVRAAFVDERLSKDWRYTLPPQERAAHRVMPMLLLIDPPEHTRLRKLVSRTFTLRRMEALRSRVREVADELIDALPGSGEVDLIARYAFQLPVLTICELLGVPPEDRDDFAAWTNVMVDNGQNGAADTQAAVGSLTAYLVQLIESKRTAPDGALISGLVEVAEDGDRLSQDELLAMVMLLLIAGQETTMNLIGNGLLALHTHPEQRALLLARPELIGPAVEELLRWESPVHTTTARFAVEDVEYAGVTIPAGSQVLLSMAAANRDEARFDRPDELRIDREEGAHAAGHIAFAHGLHHCLGAQLARIEGQEAIGRMLARRPGTELAVDPAELEYRQSDLVRGLRRLPVRPGPESSSERSAGAPGR